jgi:alkanesulfonate monooxygenase SsuD/methylene tetrahydromethanopterin reductase-like flavin-dependent oxidoreductase (luciferase family)
LDGREVTYDGTYVHLDKVQLRWPPREPARLLLGGNGPKSLQLSARSGDGSLLDAALTEAEIHRACDLVQTELSGRPGGAPHHEIVAILMVATGPGAGERVRQECARWGKPPGADIGVAGDAAAIAKGVLRLAEFGVTTVAMQPTEDEPDLLGLITLLGEQVRPLLSRPVTRHTAAATR